MADALMRLPAVLARTGLSRSAMYRLIEAKEFPAAVPLHGTVRGWLASEVDRWIEQRVEARAAEENA